MDQSIEIPKIYQSSNFVFLWLFLYMMFANREFQLWSLMGGGGFSMVLSQNYLNFKPISKSKDCLCFRKLHFLTNNCVQKICESEKKKPGFWRKNNNSDEKSYILRKMGWILHHLAKWKIDEIFQCAIVRFQFFKSKLFHFQPLCYQTNLNYP